MCNQNLHQAHRQLPTSSARFAEGSVIELFATLCRKVNSQSGLLVVICSSQHEPSPPFLLEHLNSSTPDRMWVTSLEIRI